MNIYVHISLTLLVHNKDCPRIPLSPSSTYVIHHLNDFAFAFNLMLNESEIIFNNKTWFIILD